MNCCVDRVVIDEWAGVHANEREIRAPGVDDVLRLFQKLDASVHTHLALEARDGTNLVIGGGAGRYVVYVATPDQQFWNLLSEPSKTGVVLLHVGGQEGDFPARQVVGEQQALLAARTFLSDGKLDPTLIWEREA
jgi:hypothetical protein